MRRSQSERQVVGAAAELAPEALDTASGFNIAAFNLGISGGSFVGGRLLAGPGLMTTPYAAIAMAIVALLITMLALPARPQRSHRLSNANQSANGGNSMQP